MSNQILLRPLLTEKTEKLRNDKNHSIYTFVVAKSANKIEIGKAVEAMFNVSVATVNTAIVPSKAKSRSTRTGVVRGSRSGYKKAYIKLIAGEKIDLFDDENAGE